MSAREELVDYIAGLNATICGDRCVNCTCAESEAAEANALIDAVLQEHARRLAEKIRRRCRELYGSPIALRPGLWADEGYGLLDAADLIAPKRQDARCVGCGEPTDNGQAHGYGAEFGGCV